MLTVRARGAAVLGEGGYQSFSLTPEVTWLAVVLALGVGAAIGGAAVAWYLRRRRCRSK